MSDIEGYIVPWAISGENIPIHVNWTRDTIFDNIHIQIPNDFRFVDFLNVDEVKIGSVLTNSW